MSLTAPYLECHAEHPSNDPIEDTHTIVTDDGHGGAQTSRFLRENSYAEFEKQLEKTRDPKQAFEKAFEQLDARYIDECLQNPRKAGLFAGSCAVALYFDCVKNCLWVANLGDSRAVLGNVDETGWVETVEMTTDHSAGTGVERHRVKEEHPHDATCVKEEWDEFLEVYVYLVKNICMFTRSIGDAYMKNKEVAELYNPRMDANHKVLPLPSDSKPYISNIAEVTVRPVQPGDSFIIVACDGLWDELSNHEAVTRCANFLRLAEDSERGGVAQVTVERDLPNEWIDLIVIRTQHLIDYALDKAAQRLQRQEPELGVKTRHDLLKIPPGRDGRKYLHDDITVSVVVLGTEGSRFPIGVSKAGAGAAQEPRARARWADIKKSVDMIKMMKGKESAQAGKWHSLIDDLKEMQ